METPNVDNALVRNLAIVPRQEHSLVLNVPELVGTGFRHGRALGVCFFGLIIIAAIVTVLIPREYESEAKILIMNQRADPVLTPGPEKVQPREGTTAEQMNSEVELIRSADLAERVVVDCGLTRVGRGQWEKNRNVARALALLHSQLKVEVLHKTNVISISYSSRSPELSQRVVNAVLTAYLEKHASVHNPGELAFFDQQVSRYHDDLQTAEAALTDFSQREGGAVSPDEQRRALLQRQGEFQATLDQTRSQILESIARIRMLEQQAAKEPERVTTQQRRSDNPQLLQDLKGTLLKLQLRRTDLSSKYNSTYPLVQEVDQEIAKTEAAIASAENSPLRDQTTDVNPIRQWIDSERAKAQAELRSLESKAYNLKQVVEQYDHQARAMDEQQVRYSDLLRNAKSAEDNYLLYMRKREEARITNTLDQNRILNVRVIQPATAPFLPKHSKLYYLATGLMIAFIVTAGMLVALKQVDNTLWTPYQVERFVHVPVLATFALERAPVETTSNNADIVKGPNEPVFRASKTSG